MANETINTILFLLVLHVLGTAGLSFYLCKILDLAALSDEEKESNMLRFLGCTFIVFVFCCSFILCLQENGIEIKDFFHFLKSL